MDAVDSIINEEPLDMQFTYSKVPPICEADLSYSMYPASDTVYAESRKTASSKAVLVAPGIQEVYEPLGNALNSTSMNRHFTSIQVGPGIGCHRRSTGAATTSPFFQAV